MNLLVSLEIEQTRNFIFLTILTCKHLELLHFYETTATACPTLEQKMCVTCRLP